MPNGQPPDEHSEPVRQWARRQSDVHAGLAVERLQDLVERLRRLSSALQMRGDDLTAAAVDDGVNRLRPLRDLLEDLESQYHETERKERPADYGRVPPAPGPGLVVVPHRRQTLEDNEGP
jgi:hypothetical protein